MVVDGSDDILAFNSKEHTVIELDVYRLNHKGLTVNVDSFAFYDIGDRRALDALVKYLDSNGFSVSVIERSYVGVMDPHAGSRVIRYDWNPTTKEMLVDSADKIKVDLWSLLNTNWFTRRLFKRPEYSSIIKELENL